MAYQPQRLRFGTFIAPFHPVEENPTLALERDMQLIQHLDQLDYDEAWVGEHHSAGYEIISSPELFIAGVAERTRRIRLGTGVNSLSYHNPLILADRIVQLDHQTRGRVMFGVGPGQLASDAFMQGIAVSDQRRMMGESLEAMVALLNGETVTRQTDWFSLNDARLQILPYQTPSVEMAVAAAISPSGAVAAGSHGLGMLSVAASSPEGFKQLANHWNICEQTAAKHGKTVSRDNWRVVVPMHIAETREQAMRDLGYGMLDLLRYMEKLAGKYHQYGDVKTVEQAVDIWTSDGLATFGVAMIGTPDDAVAHIRKLQEQSGGFGCMLMLAHNCADFAATKKSYELFARYVAPQFQNSNRNRRASLDWVSDNSERFIGAHMEGIKKAFEDYKPN